MAKQTINIGSSANDGTGDPLRTAFDKINDNFDELYGTSLTERVSLDTSPQLGGDLDVVTHSIVSTSNRDIVLAPHGTGAVKASSLKFSGTIISSDDSTLVQINEGLTVSGATTLSTSLALATGATVTGVDNGALGSSATLLATQGAIKTYVDAQVSASDLDFTTDDSTTNSIDLDSEVLQFSGGTGITTSASGKTVTTKIDSTVVTLVGSQTLTNKVLTNPTINAATMTGNVAVDNLIFATSEIATAGNNNLTLNPGGSGTIQLQANTAVTGTASVSGTLTTADVTTVGTQTISGALTVGTQLNIGDLNIIEDGGATKFTTDTNGDITFNPSGTGVVVIPADITHTGTQTTSGQLNVDNIRIDGNVISSTSGSITLSPAAGTNLVLGATSGGVVTASEIQATLGEFTTLRTDTLSSDTSNGNLTINTQGTGTIDLQTATNVTGNLTVSGAFIGGRQTISGAGAINLTTLYTEITTTSADAYTLANGVIGQMKIIVMVVDGGDATITPTTFANGTRVVMDAVHDSVTLIYGASGWQVIASRNVTIS
jgi:hypothetical protein